MQLKYGRGDKEGFVIGNLHSWLQKYVNTATAKCYQCTTVIILFFVHLTNKILYQRDMITNFSVLIHSIIVIVYVKCVLW